MISAVIYDDTYVVAHFDSTLVCHAIMSRDRENSDLAPDEWEPCQGEISILVRQLDKVERRRRIRQLASTATLSLVLFAVGAVLVGGFVLYREPQFGGIGCTECLSHAADYRDHLTGVKPMANLELAGKIKTHLEQCKCCGAKFRMAYPDVTLATVGMESIPRAQYHMAFMLAQSTPSY